jgi:hypothetical protein
MAFPTKIAEPTFQFGREFTPGWGELNVGETEISISGKGQASGLVLFALGWLVASLLTKQKTLAIRYGDVVNVSASGKKLTLEYKGAKGKTKRIFLMPFREKGFFGGKDSQAQYVAEMIQEKCAG